MARALYFYDPASKNFIGEFPHDPEVGFIASRRGIRRKLCSASDVDHLAEDALERYVWELYLAKERTIRDKQRKDKTKKDKNRQARKRMLVSTAKVNWEKELRTTNHNRTVKEYVRSVDMYIEAVGDHELRDFSRKNNIQYFEYLSSMKYCDKVISKTTQNKHMRHLNIFLNWAYDHEILDKRHRLKKAVSPNKDMDTYTLFDLKRARALIKDKLNTYTRPKDIRAAKNMDRAFMLATQTLLRLGPIWALRLSDIDLKRRVIRIRDVPELNFYPKKMKFPNKPINDYLFEFLKFDLSKRSPKEKWFLDKGDGEQWLKDRGNISIYAAKIFTAIGLPRIKPFHHGMRATMITYLLHNGTNPKEVQQLADHNELTTTMKYFNARTIDQTKATNNIPEL